MDVDGADDERLFDAPDQDPGVMNLMGGEEAELLMVMDDELIDRIGEVNNLLVGSDGKNYGEGLPRALAAFGITMQNLHHSDITTKYKELAIQIFALHREVLRRRLQSASERGQRADQQCYRIRNFIFKAAKQASKVTDFLLDFVRKPEPEAVGAML